MIYELRQYRVKKGRMKQWLKVMEDHILPFQVSQGMVIVAGFTAPKDKDLYVWLRRFRNEAERKRQYKKVYDSEQWRTVIEPRIQQVLDASTMVVTDLVPTATSILQ